MFSKEELQSFIRGTIVGIEYPYDTKNEKIEAYIKQLYYRIKRISNIVCEVEWDHFDSGYASFLDFFCYRKEDVVENREKEKYGILELVKTGVIINISRPAPVFILGQDERYETL